MRRMPEELQYIQLGTSSAEGKGLRGMVHRVSHVEVDAFIAQDAAGSAIVSRRAHAASRSGLGALFSIDSTASSTSR